MKKTIIFSLIFSIFAIMSCSKEDQFQGITPPSVAHTKSAVANIPYYANIDSVLSLLRTFSQFDSIEDYFAYETRTGRLSLGRMADEFYYNVDFDIFTNENQMNTFLRTNAQKLDIEISATRDTTILPLYYDHPFRYLADSNGMFQIGDTVVKIMKDLVIFSHRNYYTQLSLINESNFNITTNNPNIHYYTLNSKRLTGFSFNTWWNYIYQYIISGNHSTCIAITPNHGVSSTYTYSPDSKWRMMAQIKSILLLENLDISFDGITQNMIAAETPCYEIMIRTEKKNKLGKWHLKNKALTGSISAKFHYDHSMNNQQGWSFVSFSKNLNSEKGRPYRYVLLFGESTPMGFPHETFHLANLKLNIHSDVINSFYWEL